MELLKERILKDGKVRSGDVLKVDSFLNHQMDINLFEEIINKELLTRRINISANNLMHEDKVVEKPKIEQFDLFDNRIDKTEIIKKQKIEESEEKELQKALLNIKNKYGKNAILKGMNYEEGGTTIERNGQIGGHKG